MESILDSEIKRFEERLPELVSRYSGDKYIAMYQGKVIARGNKEMEVFDDAFKKVGNVPFYITTIQQFIKLRDFRKKEEQKEERGLTLEEATGFNLAQYVGPECPVCYSIY